MKISLVLIILVIFAFVTVLTDGRGEKELHITLLTIQFEKTNATFIANYHFDRFSRLYLMMLGSKSIEPKVRSLFSNFDFEIIKLDQDKAILKVKNISRLDKDYYLHDSQKFGDTIDRVMIYSPDSIRPREYFYINATPYFFYRS